MTKTADKEFIVLMAVLMSLLALTIDTILPALPLIGEELDITNINDAQFIITTVFLGMAAGLMLYGPVADSFGRKMALYIGISIFLIGDLISWFASDFSWMIIGRFIQGFGVASCRVVCLAMIRDKFEGPAMAKIMSSILLVFVVVPALAPSIGQGILHFFDWRAIFAIVFCVGLIAIIWLTVRQQETLNENNRKAFSLDSIYKGVKETVQHPTTRLYTLTSGLIYGSFVGYITSSQQIFQTTYKLGDQFALYFGIMALVLGLAIYANTKLVERHRLESLCRTSILLMWIINILYFTLVCLTNYENSLTSFLIYLTATFFCIGILFGNLNTLAVQPLGHIAGVASSVIASVQSLLSSVLGGIIAYAFDGSVLPLVVGFLVSASLSLYLIYRAKDKSKQVSNE